MTLLSVRALRAEGCELPVEILIPTMEEYELELCSRIFPAMNARCIYLPMQFKGEQLSATKLEFSGYQYKCLAILLSSFENVLLLDSDNVAAYAPDHLFKHEPFLSKGLIVWPDFWKRSTSPDYFKIANIQLSQSELYPKYDEKYGEYRPQEYELPLDLDKIPLHDRVGAMPDPSSESGQLMISKRTHMKQLLLALYYNYYGPTHYYPLFSQGAAGEGDKETFLAATIVTKKVFIRLENSWMLWVTYVTGILMVMGWVNSIQCRITNGSKRKKSSVLNSRAMNTLKLLTSLENQRCYLSTPTTLNSILGS